MDIFRPEIIAPIGSFIFVVWIVKISLDAKLKHKLIDKGVEADVARNMFRNIHQENYPSSLKWGMVFIAIGAALFIGEYFPRYLNDGAILGLVSIFAGVALVIFYLLNASAAKKNNQSE